MKSPGLGKNFFSCLSFMAGRSGALLHLCEEWQQLHGVLLEPFGEGSRLGDCPGSGFKHRGSLLVEPRPLPVFEGFRRDPGYGQHAHPRH